MLNLKIFRQINHVIEYDSTASTYKYALLKNVIDVCQKYDHLIRLEEGEAIVPLGLVVEGWIFDYLPFVFEKIRQQQARNRVLNREIEEAYEVLFESFALRREEQNWKEAYGTIRQSYEELRLNEEQSEAMLALAKESARTIAQMPMRYAGRYVERDKGPKEYGLFDPERHSFGRVSLRRKEAFDREFLVHRFGTFTMKQGVYDIFRYLGQSLQGRSTIARRWIEKSCAMNRERCLSESPIAEMIYGDYYDPRDTIFARSLLPDRVECVWTGEEIPRSEAEIDHLLPYSVWHNNDLWNLLPSTRKINGKKRDKIPDPDLIEKRKEAIEMYWKIYDNSQPKIFRYQVRSSLGDSSKGFDGLLESLKGKARYLIEDRGLQPFAG